MYTRILVAVDGSRTSRRAFEAALALASLHGAVLQPLYVVESMPMYYEAPGYDPSVLRNGLLEQGKELGLEFARDMAAQGVKGEVVVSEAAGLDDVSTAVLKAAADFNADLLVMGTHGRRGFQRLILGSVAERCVRQARLPVLLIPSAAGQSSADEEADA
ncbi:MAG TPA: universal stress protein [Paraburkholderia sp.]|uniref:universal stress protein n=1 Tax=Paraburkholderia sp. TaxID=1926495 RepID=UPI002ED341BE